MLRKFYLNIHNVRNPGSWRINSCPNNSLHFVSILYFHFSPIFWMMVVLCACWATYLLLVTAISYYYNNTAALALKPIKATTIVLRLVCSFPSGPKQPRPMHSPRSSRNDLDVSPTTWNAHFYVVVFHRPSITINLVSTASTPAVSTKINLLVYLQGSVVVQVFCFSRLCFSVASKLV